MFVRFYIFVIIYFCLTSESFILVPSCDRRVSSAAVPSAVRYCCPLGQLGARRRGRRHLSVGGTWLQPERVHDVAHFLLCQFPVLLPAAGAPEGETRPTGGADRHRSMDQFWFIQLRTKSPPFEILGFFKKDFLM